MQRRAPLRLICYHATRLPAKAIRKLKSELFEQGKIRHLLFRQNEIRYPLLSVSVCFKRIMMQVALSCVIIFAMVVDMHRNIAVREYHVALRKRKRPS